MIAPRLPALVLASALAAACSGSPPAPAAPPNVVVVVVDTLRADRLPLYGGDRAETPFLDSLAAESLVFDGTWSTSSWTAPATASLFTSLYPSQHGVLTGLKVARNQTDEDEVRLNRLPPEVETLPELMQRAGYRTFGAVDNPTVCGEMGFTRGFDRYAQFDYAGAETILGQARAWRGELAASEPFFLYLHLMDPHGPYHPRAPWFDPTVVEGDLWERIVEVLGHPPEALLDAETAEWIDALGIAADSARMAEAHALVREAYDSEISWLDRRLEEAFEALPIDAETLIVFTADHGEELGERGAVGHGYQVHDELVRLPLFLRLPASERERFPPRRIEGTFSLVDLLPTLRAFLGTAPSEHDAGIDLLGPEAESERVLLAERHREGSDGTIGLKAAVQVGDLKAHFEEPAGAARLYDLASDPGESHDLAAERPADVERLREAWRETSAELRRYERSFAAARALDAEERAVLERLGYVDGEPNDG